MADPPRQCGDCSLCCKTMGIRELNKPKDVWCQHFARGQGCAIYADRPPSCRSFACNWLRDPGMGPEWKPNTCKMVVETREKTLGVHVDPGADQPWRKEPYFSQLLRIATQRVGQGGMVVVIEHGRSIVILPDRGVDLGVLDPADRIELGEVMTATGWRWEVSVDRASAGGGGKNGE